MMKLCSDVLTALTGKTLVTAESLTGGWIGQALTAVPGASAVYKGGVICYSNWVKSHVLHVAPSVLERYGAVSDQVAGKMVSGVRKLMEADVAVAVTGLAGPDGDEYGHPVGTVYISYEDAHRHEVKNFLFSGSRDQIRTATVRAALEMILAYNR